MPFDEFPAGASPKDGVPDMTVISEIDEYGINENLRVRYNRERIYVSPAQCSPSQLVTECRVYRPTLDPSWWRSILTNN